jgi:hypothetical protein
MEVKSLQDKGAIFQDQTSTATFLWPKEAEGWLIIDLSRLNQFLRLPHFKMETTRLVAAAILPGEWTVSLGSITGPGTRIFTSVPVHPDYQHYLRLYFIGRVYHFKAMTFGLASAPLIFQSIVKALVAPLHTLGLKLHFYLDNCLLRNVSKDILKKQMELLIKNVKLAGWIMNKEKSELTPSHRISYSSGFASAPVWD